MGKLSQNFNYDEFICKCGKCGFKAVDPELIAVLEDVDTI